MDMRTLEYIENRLRDEPNRHRNPIGFSDDDEYRRRNHKEEYFDDEDFEEPKHSKLFTRTGGHQKNQGKEMEELLELMEKSFRKELCDVMRYCHMAEIAEESGLKDIHEGLKELYHDEFTHAKFFKAAIRYFGEDIEKSDPELEKLWHKAKRKIEE